MAKTFDKQVQRRIENMVPKYTLSQVFFAAALNFLEHHRLGTTHLISSDPTEENTFDTFEAGFRVECTDIDTLDYLATAAGEYTAFETIESMIED